MPGIEFAAGFVCLVLGAGASLWAIRRGRRAIEITFWAAVLLEIAVISSLFFDWGYFWVEKTAIDIAMESNIWIAVPHASAAATLMMLAVWGRAYAPWAVLTTLIQTLSFVPVIILVGQDTDTSFLEIAPMSALFASVLATFWFVPYASTSIPETGGKWHSIAFGPRQILVDAIAGLESIGLVTRGPYTVFDSGQAYGNIGDVRVLVDTRPSVLPPAYAVRITWILPSIAPDTLPDPPCFTRTERIGRRRGSPDIVDYVGLSPAGFDIGEECLSGFIRRVAASLA